MSDETEKKTDAPAPGAPTLAAIPRTLEQIQQEYMKTIQELGNITWQREILENQQNGLYAKLNELIAATTLFVLDRRSPGDGKAAIMYVRDKRHQDRKPS